MSYFEIVKKSLADLFNDDDKLFEKEQTYSFRLALHLAKDLETDSNGLFVDCEYHSDYLRTDKLHFR